MSALLLCLISSFITMTFGAPILSSDNAPKLEPVGDDVLNSLVRFWTRQEPVPAAGTTLDTPAILAIVGGSVVVIALVVILFICGRAKRYPSRRV
ncbi:hypothetical protein F4781DRAFT_411164, partial [Annulohypoxylon bovei var. microspora]